MTEDGITPTNYTVDSQTGCGLWQRLVRSGGHPQASFQGRTVSPARHAYERAIGPIPAGHLLYQMCGNTRCVNPAHQQPATREARVQEGAAAKLSAARVRGIKRLAAERTTVELAAAFGVSAVTITHVLQGKGWRNTGPAASPLRWVRSPIRKRWRGRLHAERPPSSSARDWVALVEYVNRASGQEVAAAFGISRPNMRGRLARASQRLATVLADGDATLAEQHRGPLI